MTSEQFDEVLAYDSLEPLGPDRLYQLLCRIGAAICSALGADYNPKVFDPINDQRVEVEPAEFQSPEAAAAMMRAHADNLGV